MADLEKLKNEDLHKYAGGENVNKDDIANPSIPDEPEPEPEVTKKNKSKLFPFRIGENEQRMIKELKEIHFINISEYLRASIKHLHKSRTKEKKK